MRSPEPGQCRRPPSSRVTPRGSRREGHGGRDPDVALHREPDREHEVVAHRRCRCWRARRRPSRSTRAPVLDLGPHRDRSRHAGAPARPRPLRGSGRCSRGRGRRSRSRAAATDASRRRPGRCVVDETAAHPASAGRLAVAVEEVVVERQRAARSRSMKTHSADGVDDAPRSPIRLRPALGPARPGAAAERRELDASWYTGGRDDLEVARAQHPDATRLDELGVVDVVGGDVLQEARQRLEAHACRCRRRHRGAHADDGGTTRPRAGTSTYSASTGSWSHGGPVGIRIKEPRGCAETLGNGVTWHRPKGQRCRDSSTVWGDARFGIAGGSSACGSSPPSRSWCSRDHSTASTATTSGSPTRSRRPRSTSSRSDFPAASRDSAHRRVPDAPTASPPRRSSPRSARASTALGKIPNVTSVTEPVRSGREGVHLEERRHRGRHRAVRHAGAGPRQGRLQADRSGHRAGDAGRHQGRVRRRGRRLRRPTAVGQRRPHRPARRGHHPAVRVRLGRRDGPAHPHRALRARRRVSRSSASSPSFTDDRHGAHRRSPR